jgi:hypothetical protein
MLPATDVVNDSAQFSKNETAYLDQKIIQTFFGKGTQDWVLHQFEIADLG